MLKVYTHIYAAIYTHGDSVYESCELGYLLKQQPAKRMKKNKKMWRYGKILTFKEGQNQIEEACSK